VVASARVGARPMTAAQLVPKRRIPWPHILCFGWMPSALKVACYRWLLGYRIGAGVHLGWGAVVVADEATIGDHVEIGFFTIMRGRRISVGRRTQIGSTSYLMCEVIEIGEDAKINEQVFVGGPMLPESLFRLGSRTIVMQMSFLNPTKPLIIGDDSGIGGHCLLFTHGSWLNVLDGYPVTFAGITIGKSVWLPWRVFVLPGTTIGDGSVIGANSLVQGTIPPLSLAAGSPAKVIRSAPDFPRRPDDARRRALIDEMVAEFNRFVTYSGVRFDGTGRYEKDGRRYRLHRLGPGAPLPDDLGSDVVVLSDTAPSRSDEERLGRTDTSWLNLATHRRSRDGNPLCEELALFLSRYGIRLARDA
jgi:acetyltransferase-like isoleucine patch superfamily enzyme